MVVGSRTPFNVLAFGIPIGGSLRPAIPNRTMRSVSVYPASPTKIAAAFGFIAFVLLA